MRALAALGKLDEASKAAARLAAARAKVSIGAGKKQFALDLARDRAIGTSRFATPPPPKPTLN